MDDENFFIFYFFYFSIGKKKKKFADAQIAEKKLPTTVTQTEDFFLALPAWQKLEHPPPK